MLIVEQSKAKQNRLNNIQPNKQLVKHLPAMWETWVQSLGREDPLENETATHSSTLAWKIPWTGEPGRLQSVAKSLTQLRDFTFTFTNIAS